MSALIFHLNLSLLPEILGAVDAFISNYHLNLFTQEHLFLTENVQWLLLRWAYVDMKPRNLKNSRLL